jgi:hypothetical protein
VIGGSQRNTIRVSLAADNPSTLKWVRRRIAVDAKGVTDYVKFGKEEPCEMDTAALKPPLKAVPVAKQPRILSLRQKLLARAMQAVQQALKLHPRSWRLLLSLHLSVPMWTTPL